MCIIIQIGAFIKLRGTQLKDNEWYTCRTFEAQVSFSYKERTLFGYTQFGQAQDPNDSPIKPFEPKEIITFLSEPYPGMGIREIV